MEPIALHDGRIMQVHSGENCAITRAAIALPHCVIHRPSEHPLNTAPLNWREDRRLFERMCEHGIGHPDPDGVRADVLLLGYDPRGRGIHGCDGCCS